MRRIRIGTLALGILAAGCGGSTHFVNKPRPPTPINLTVYVNNSRVSVSPSSVGAGPTVLIVTNQSSNAETVTVFPTGSPASQLATTGPINPQATAQVTVNLSPPGEYTVASATGGTSEAAAATATPIQPAVLHVGPTRPSASNQLLQP